MCTAISYRKGNHYFGRNLDVDFSYREQVVITPRNYAFRLKNGTDYKTQFALIGIATVMENYPMYYEAANEKGLSVAGLNFPGNAVYETPIAGKDNIALFEFIPWVLGQAETVQETRKLLARINLTNIPFSENMPTAELHFMFSDKNESIVVEPTAAGLQIYDNSYDVLTNNPPFPYHLQNMNNYLHLSPRNHENTFSDKYSLSNYCVGMGALGLPGDVSSESRFVRAVFNLANSENEENELDTVTQFFHVLDSVAMVQGATITPAGRNDITLYSCCINADKGIFYYKTYKNNQITAIRMHNVDLDASTLYAYDLNDTQQILYGN